MIEASPKKVAPAQKKKPAVKKPAVHPKFIEMIMKAITELKERNGSSKQAIEKYIKDNFKVGDNARVYIKQSLVKGVQAGVLKQVKGQGASGSFKLGEKAKAKPKVKKTVTKKKPAAKKPAAKKSTPKKKTAAKKSASKKTSAKKPKSAKKTVKKTTAKKPTPKKVKKTAAKKKASSAKKAKK